MNSKENTPNEATPAINIEDYLLEANPSKDVKVINADSPYKVLYQTASDFIISRKKARSEVELVILISEDLFYFKKKDKIEDITYERLQAFLKDLCGDSIELEQVLWLPKLNNDKIKELISIIRSSTYVSMCRDNIIIQYGDLYWCSDFWEKNAELFKRVYFNAGNIGIQSLKELMTTAFEIENRFGYDEALYFIDAFEKTGIKRYSNRNYRYSLNNDFVGFFGLLEEPYNFDLYRLIDYIFVDALSQGITVIDSDFWNPYKKYLDMQIKVFGEIRDKYPKYLMTEYNAVTLNFALIDDGSYTEDFLETTKKIDGLAYEGKKYSIITPSSIKEIAKDGAALCHCMGTNASQLSSGGHHILFLRNTNAKDEPLMTLQYSGGTITNAEGLYRRELASDERKFLDIWGKEKNVFIAA